jgi:hypothetical protein
MAMVHTRGRTAVSTKVTGTTANSTAKDYTDIQMGRSAEAVGRTGADWSGSMDKMTKVIERGLLIIL